MSVLRDKIYSVFYNHCKFFFSGHLRGGDILIFKGSKAISKALHFIKFSDLSYGVHCRKL